jgi:Leucine-rich repeat (LRR) protein
LGVLDFVGYPESNCDLSFFLLIFDSYLSEMNLQKAIANVDFSKVLWTAIAFTNANLKEVPTGLAKLSLQYVELSKNYISNISDAAPFKNVSTLCVQVEVYLVSGQAWIPEL